MSTASTPSLPYDATRLCALAHLLIGHIHELAHAGWTPATSSNFSHRLDEHHVAITVSGRDKRCLVEEDIMVVDLNG
ncbi:MAG TPA: class II aldolase/adducin family protein, partial [Xylella taiwanensis]